jgi:nicotinamidase-related amidase
VSPARLVAVDLQRIFADGPWGTPGFEAVVAPVLALAQAYEPVFTRFVAPAEPAGAWREYYDAWPFARQPADAPDYALAEPFAAWAGDTVDDVTFGKWPAIERRLRPEPGDRFVVAGVSTDCCVLSTVLAAADAGMYVQVVEDACAGVTPDSHTRALEAMRMYPPQVEIVRSADLLGAG